MQQVKKNEEECLNDNDEWTGMHIFYVCIHNKITRPLALIILILLTSNINGQDTLTIMAKSGVFLRKYADIKSPILKKIAYAEKVVTQLDTNMLTEIQIEELKDFFISGQMKMVNYNGIIGYVFSGFLTNFPIPSSCYNPDNHNIQKDADLNYLETNFAPFEKYEIKKYSDYQVGNDEKNICSCKIKFNRNIEYYFNRCDERGGEVNIKIPKLSIHEAYFFSKILFINYSSCGTEDDCLYFYNKSKNELIIKPKDSGAGCYYSITETGDILTIHYFCGD